MSAAAQHKHCQKLHALTARCQVAYWLWTALPSCLLPSQARGRGPTSTSSHTSVLAFGASRGGRGETTPTTTSGYLSSSNTSAREAPSRSTAGSASVSTPRSSSGILQVRPRLLVL